MSYWRWRDDGRVPWAIVLLGLPGAGKGTQASTLSRLLGFDHLSTGNLFREAMKRADATGKSLAQYVDAGELVPDAITREIVLQALGERVVSPGIILDGYPRTQTQAQDLEDFLTRRALRSTIVLIDVPVPVLLDRLSGRRVCVARGHPYHLTEQPPAVPDRCDVDGSPLTERTDDRQDVVARRLAEQSRELEVVVGHYARLGVLRTVQGHSSSRAVTAAMLDAITEEPTEPNFPKWIHPDRGWIIGIVPEAD